MRFIALLRGIEMLDRQEGSNRQEEGTDGRTHDDAQQQQQMEEPDVTYDALILIPNNAVILDLDYDLLRLIPDDVLASLSRKSQDSNKAREEVGNVDELDLMNVEGEGGDADADDDQPMDLTETVVVFNLQHPYAKSVVREWSDLALTRRRCDFSSELASTPHEHAHDGANGQAPDCCGQVGDARLLLQAIQNVRSSAITSSLVLNLTESGDGFVGRSDDNPHAIKAITLATRLVCQRQASRHRRRWMLPLPFRPRRTRSATGTIPSAKSCDLSEDLSSQCWLRHLLVGRATNQRAAASFISLTQSRTIP
jgi:hypothetical protein